jgi:hypothetical protein
MEEDTQSENDSEALPHYRQKAEHYVATNPQPVLMWTSRVISKFLSPAVSFFV